VAEDRRLKMKDLEAETGVGREAIRYYINQGLLPEPEKPKRNVAFYTDEHVSRIRAIRFLQEKRYLPLSVIRNLLEHDEAAALTAGHAMPGLEHLLPALVDGATPAPRLSVAEAAGQSGLPEADVRELAALGIVAIAEDGSLDFRDAAIVRVWGELQGAGFTRQRGYDPASLTLYLETTRWLAKEEVGRFLDHMSGHLDSRQGAQAGAAGVRLGNELIALLRTRAIIEALNDR
jgi:DNA-binding transcriptional MerR regulator